MEKQSAEADKIYSALFKREMPAILRKRFDDASQFLYESLDQNEIDDYFALISRCKDIEAAEYAARFFGGNTLLSKKIKLMVWLTSTMPEHFDCFVNTSDRKIYGKASLFIAGFYSAYKLLIGSIILATRRRKHA